MIVNHPETIQRILKENSTIAVVGLSSKPFRPSYGVASYMQAAGYRIIPVNPFERSVLGEISYPTLRDVPDKIEIVNIFRRSETVIPIVGEAIHIGACAIWMQEGVYHEEAIREAEKAGLLVVADRCMLKEHMKLLREARPASFTRSEPGGDT